MLDPLTGDSQEAKLLLTQGVSGWSAKSVLTSSRSALVEASNKQGWGSGPVGNGGRGIIWGACFFWPSHHSVFGEECMKGRVRSLVSSEEEVLEQNRVYVSWNTASCKRSCSSKTQLLFMKSIIVGQQELGMNLWDALVWPSVKKSGAKRVFLAMLLMHLCQQLVELGQLACSFLYS